MRTVLVLLVVAVGTLLGVLAVRTLRFTSVPAPVAPVAPWTGAEAAQRLARAVRIRAASYPDAPDSSAAGLLALHGFLAEAYPRAHAALRREVVNTYSLLYTWPGRDTTRAPMLLTGHLDTVPADPETIDAWTHPPFAGVVADGYVWGRGSMDDRFTVVGVLEAVERLVAEGFQPARTVYLAFGHDEELGGMQGAARIADLLQERGVRPAFVLDEGLFIAEGLVPGIDPPVALVGIAEKGAVSLTLAVEQDGGHAATPPPETAIGVLSRALARLETHPSPARLEGPARHMFDRLGPEMPFLQRLAFANLWLFESLVTRRLTAEPTTAALVRTTLAPTIVRAGVKENVLPGYAEAVVNSRILPGDSVAGVIARVEAIIADPRVRITPRPGASEPSPVSDPGAPAFAAIDRAIRAVYPDVLVAPSLLVARTDARHYAGLAEAVYRFVPLRVGRADTGRFHGVDERVPVEDVARGVRFYYELLASS